MKNQIHRFLFYFFTRNAQQILDRKCAATDDLTRTLVMQEDERGHYGDMEISEKASEYVLKSFTIDRIDFIKRNTSDNLGDTVIDLGDSNGIFLRSISREGISVNISGPAVESLQRRGMVAVKADIEHLPFKTGSIRTVFLFETLEHVPNPIALLREIDRICSDSAIISIPYVTTTNILPHNYDPGRPIFQHHIFEFTPQDFSTIVSHTHFSISAEKIATVLDGKSGILDRIIFFFWATFCEKDMFCGCFKQFYICKLNKTNIGRSR
jgi:2-polyprenyl-3-methyl-5-hydroxy-6-metoxy-1,4-benzoquinol methylase